MLTGVMLSPIPVLGIVGWLYGRFVKQISSQVSPILIVDEATAMARASPSDAARPNKCHRDDRLMMDNLI